MRKKKIVLAAAFVAIAMISGGIVSIYGINKDSVEIRGAAQDAIVDTAQPENSQPMPTELQHIIPTNEISFSCEIPGCTLTETHQHGLCGIDGCTQIGEHSHDICSIAECTESGTHMHNGEYCYPHATDDGHAYHNCGVSGCTRTEAHSHSTNSSGQHHSGHGSGHH